MFSFHYRYKKLTGDNSAAANLELAETDKRGKLTVDMEDVDMVLRHLNSDRKSTYKLFWLECSKFIQESITQAVDERRHQRVSLCHSHVGSRLDLTGSHKVSRRNSNPWVWLQFLLKNRH